MVHREAERIGSAVVEALRRTRQRGLLLTGWGGWTPDPLPADVFAIEAVPHDWLFPRCSVIVHHGGAGTTAAGLRSGKPNVVVPFAGDQPFWGKRVAALGAGPAPIPVRKLDADALTTALKLALSDASIPSRAAEIGSQVRAEDGVGETVKIIEACQRSFKKG
jgi:sterol 3beta-glucosyltransferase